MEFLSVLSSLVGGAMIGLIIFLAWLLRPQVKVERRTDGSVCWIEYSNYWLYFVGCEGIMKLTITVFENMTGSIETREERTWGTKPSRMLCNTVKKLGITMIPDPICGTV